MEARALLARAGISPPAGSCWTAKRWGQIPQSSSLRFQSLRERLVKDAVWASAARWESLQSTVKTSDEISLVHLLLCSNLLQRNQLSRDERREKTRGSCHPRVQMWRTWDFLPERSIRRGKAK